MNLGFSRRAAPWAVVLLAAGAACSPQRPGEPCDCPVKNKEHVVLLRAEEQKKEPPTPEKHWKAIAHPDHITIRGYNPDNPDTVVIWSYRHKSTHIKFNESTPPIPDPVCDDPVGECSLKLPKGLAHKKPYKYTITGKYDDKTDLDPNDPWIEVDR
ncbi:MAG TPA: hypothetical protein VLJ18_04600 [Thermoanaerobaculia bacterium]|nr:hypothetical protein [Thermoanaerobaculia bacterium]